MLFEFMHPGSWFEPRGEVKIYRLYRVPGSIPAVNKWGSGIDPRTPFIDLWGSIDRVPFWDQSQTKSLGSVPDKTSGINSTPNFWDQSQSKSLGSVIDTCSQVWDCYQKLGLGLIPEMGLITDK